ncbi:hypothetical protein HK097_007221 [Rhizophlyctis rosea]|uniref:Glycoside hydrolase 131 catalytic N-terminal domain-containing protein n=1 Tax=Rhizophlyctis rosea TaxID=64517 RepID=A0AAD5SBY8_9FUNG|nr:hypothetical protein HK097_007221 [Rhizophlyctis rosea]
MGAATTFVALLAAASAVAAQAPYFDGRFYKKTWNNNAKWDNQSLYGTWARGAIPIAYNFSHYTELSPAYKNPWDKIDQQGVSITVDNSSYWLPFHPFFRRTEFIPLAPSVEAQNTSTDTWYYHASIKQDPKHTLEQKFEHQFFFHERDFDYRQNFGVRWGGDAKDKIQFYTEDPTIPKEIDDNQRRVRWEIKWDLKTWYNFVFGVNMKNKQITMYYSTNGNALKLAAYATVPNLKGGQFHLGQLRFVNETLGQAKPEKLWFSGVKVEKNRLSSTFGFTGPAYPKPTTTTTTKKTTTTKGYQKPVFVKVA